MIKIMRLVMCSFIYDVVDFLFQSDATVGAFVNYLMFWCC